MTIRWLNNPGYLSDSQFTRVRLYASKLLNSEEDIEDFIQECLHVAWSNIKLKKIANKGNKTYILDIDYVIKESQRSFFKNYRNKTESRPGDALQSDKFWEIEAETRPFATFGELIGYMVPTNPIDRATSIKWKLQTENGSHLWLDYSEAAELTRTERHSVIVNRMKRTGLRVLLYEGNFYANCKQAERKTGHSSYRIRSNSEWIRMNWLD